MVWEVYSIKTPSCVMSYVKVSVSEEEEEPHAKYRSGVLGLGGK